MILAEGMGPEVESRILRDVLNIGRPAGAGAGADVDGQVFALRQAGRKEDKDVGDDSLVKKE